MPSNRLYLLDTNVILALARMGPLGNYIDGTFGLTKNPSHCMTSIVCEGEIGVFQAAKNWGEAKRAFVAAFFKSITVVEIADPKLVEAYVAIDLFLRHLPQGAKNIGQNDKWIAALAKETGAHLLTTDTDFEELDPAMIKHTYIDPAKHGKHPSKPA